MPNIQRVRVEWNGPALVGPAVSTFYFAEDHVGFQADLLTFFDTIKARFPVGSGISIPSSGDVLDAETGDLVNVWTDGTTSGVGFSGGANHASGVGARIKWLTIGFAQGRRVTGSTYLVPLSTTQFDTDGTLLAATVTGINSAISGLMTASGSNMRIWKRPVAKQGGGVSTVASGSVVDKTSWLRSRRT